MNDSPETMEMDADEEFDALLRSALRARPELQSATNLAASAIRRATALSSTQQVHIRRRPIFEFGAAIGVIMVLIAGALRLSSIRAAISTYESAAYSTTSSATTSTSEEFTLLLAIGCIALIATIAFLFVQGSFTLDRDLTPSLQ